MDKYEEREFKCERIVEEYSKRKTQKEVAGMFDMDEKDVSTVTQKYNYKHTRKITPETIREGESMKAFIQWGEFDFLDKYPIQKFEK